MADLTLRPFTQPFAKTLAPPGSKSLTNRALVMAALAKGETQLGNVLFADDTRVMLDGLARLGFTLEIDEPNRRVRVHGRAGEVPASEASLFCGNSGTTIRFLAALCTLGKGRYTLDGVPRMRQRPIGALTSLLTGLGAKVSHDVDNPGYPPIHVEADGLPGGKIAYGSELSSQYLSAVLMVSPYARDDEVVVDLAAPQTSWPYVAMTMRLMDHFGVTPELVRNPKTGEPQKIHVPQGHFHAGSYPIEPDASNASYFLAAAAIHPGSKVTVEGLGKRSLQGDVAFADLLRQMGADLVFGADFITVMGAPQLGGIEADLSDMPDTAQTLAVTALFADGPSTLTGLHTLRVKETDRVAALATELRKLGAEIEVEGDDLHITPPAGNRLTPAAIDTYDDHRMAMSFAIAGTKQEGVTIRNPECVNKTYPEFFADLETLRE